MSFTLKLPIKNQTQTHQQPIDTLDDESMTDVTSHQQLDQDHLAQVQNEIRDLLVQKVKDIGLEQGFKVKMPYADRLDKNQARTVNIFCHHFKNSHQQQLIQQQHLLGRNIQKVQSGQLNQSGCSFRIMYKSKPIKIIQEDNNQQEEQKDSNNKRFMVVRQEYFIHKYNQFHNHELDYEEPNKLKLKNIYS
eukprot:403344437